jgi:HEAT repeat protein
VAFLIALLSPAPGRDKQADKPDKPDKADKPAAKDKDKEKAKDKAALPKQLGDDYREFFKKPETAQEYWDAMNFEIEVGEYGLAAKHLKGFLAKKPATADLLKIEEEKGISTFLRLRNIPKWSDDSAENAEAQKNVEELIKLVTDEVKKHLGDPEHLKKYSKNLADEEPEVRAYALKELYRSGALAVPFILDELRQTEGVEHSRVLSGLALLRPETIPPIVASLEGVEPGLRVELIDVLKKRLAKQAVPFLWHLSAASSQPSYVQKKAAETIAYLLDAPGGSLPSAKVALVNEAERYYQHKVHFADPTGVTIWRWDAAKNHLAEPAVVTASQAEGYYGLYFADQALDLDPGYHAAQVVHLSLVLEKGLEQSGLDKPASKGVQRLVSTVNPDLINAVLERAIADQRVRVIVGAARALGELADTRALRPVEHSQPALVRALSFADRRVQLTAAEALLRIPQTNPTASGRIVEIMRRAVAVEPSTQLAPRVLVGYGDVDTASAVAAKVKQAGFDPVVVHTGREAIARAAERADVDAMLIHYGLTDPGFPYLLGQLRADINVGRLPLVLVVPKDREESFRRFVGQYRNVSVLPEVLAFDAEALKHAIKAGLDEVGSQPLTPAEQKDYAEHAIQWFAAMATGGLPGYDVRPAAKTLIETLQSDKLSDRGLAAAIVTVGRLPAFDGVRPQSALAGFVLSSKYKPALRSAAAQELLRHIQLHGAALGAGEVKSLEELVKTEKDEGVQANVALVIGGLRPSNKVTGERLRGFTPSVTAPAPAAPPAEKKEDKAEKKEDKPPEKD